MQNGEFIPAEARDQIGVTNGGGKAPGCGAQQFFLRGMAKIGRDMPQPIQIQHMHRNTGGAAGGADQRGADPGDEHGEIGQPRNAILPPATWQAMAGLKGQGPCPRPSIADDKAKARGAIQGHFPFVFIWVPGGGRASLHQGRRGIGFQPWAVIEQIG